MKVGLFGGTFSPPHIGHVRAAKCFKSGADLDRLIVMPDCIPPHKKEDIYGTPDIRLQLAHLAFDDIAEVSDYEIKKGGTSYTVDTINWLENQLSEKDKIFLCVGTDMFLSFETWRQPAEIFRMAAVVCMKRTDDSSDETTQKKQLYETKYNARIIVLPFDALPVSSSEIREKCAVGDDVSMMLPDKVADYIKRTGLYK